MYSSPSETSKASRVSDQVELRPREAKTDISSIQDLLRASDEPI